MRNCKLMTQALCIALLATWLAGGCTKVRDPQADPTPAAGATLSPDQDQPGPAPVIACDQPSHDFGTVPQGDDAVHVFTIRNKGQGVLKIDRARGG